MSSFTCYCKDTAPDKSKPLLDKSKNDFGMIPNLHGVMAESPAVLSAYQTLHDLALSTRFSDSEKTVIWQTVNIEHNCHYCLPVHSAIARTMKVPETIDDALRNHEDLDDASLNALRDFTQAVIRQRGRVKDQLPAFYQVGYQKQHVLEVILSVSQKVMSNYINHITDTPLDQPFQKFA